MLQSQRLLRTSDDVGEKKKKKKTKKKKKKKKFQIIVDVDYDDLSKISLQKKGQRQRLSCTVRRWTEGELQMKTSLLSTGLGPKKLGLLIFIDGRDLFCVDWRCRAHVPTFQQNGLRMALAPSTRTNRVLPGRGVLIPPWVFTVRYSRYVVRSTELR